MWAAAHGKTCPYCGGENVKILLPGTEPQGLAGSKEKKPSAALKAQIRRRECEDFAPRNGVTRVRGERGAKGGRAPGDREGEIRWRECEDFAPRNGATRVNGERGAKRGRQPPGRASAGPCSGICTRKNLHFYTQSCIIIPTPLKTPRRSGFTAISIREIAVNPYYHRAEAPMRV